MIVWRQHRPDCSSAIWICCFHFPAVSWVFDVQWQSPTLRALRRWPPRNAKFYCPKKQSGIRIHRNLNGKRNFRFKIDAWMPIWLKWTLNFTIEIVGFVARTLHAPVSLLDTGRFRFRTIVGYSAVNGVLWRWIISSISTTHQHATNRVFQHFVRCQHDRVLFRTLIFIARKSWNFIFYYYFFFFQKKSNR